MEKDSKAFTDIKEQKQIRLCLPLKRNLKLEVSIQQYTTEKQFMTEHKEKFCTC